MYTHNIVCTCMTARNVNEAGVLDLISEAIYIRSEKFKIQTPPLIWQEETKFQMLLGLGRRPTVVGQRPTTIVQNLRFVKKIKVAQEGILN